MKQVEDAAASEREATITQTAKVVAAEREAIVLELQRQEGTIRGIVGDVTRLVERADQAGASVNAATTQTVTSAELAARRTLDHASVASRGTLDHAFVLALVLVLLTLLGIPAVLFTYRLAHRRWIETPVAGRAARNG